MYTHSQFQEQVAVQSPKIYFSQKIFGKPTKNRTEDPSMFQLLAWNNNGIEPSNFKKKQRFTDPSIAYVNMISKKPWISQSQQSYLNFHKNTIQVNEQVFHQVQNYIQSHQSKQKQKGHHQSVSNDKVGKNLTNEQNKMRKQNNWQGKERSKNIVPNVKSNNYLKDGGQKQNILQVKQKDTKKRPVSAKNISNLGSPNVKSLKQMTGPVVQEDDQILVKKRDQISGEQQQKLIQKFKQTTRWIPNSSFTTYFGKPPFQNYGRGNTKPVDGGLVYGTYLYSHNVYPHRGSNSPSHVQTYPVALMKAKSMGMLIPTQPKTSCKYLENKINNEKQRQYDGSGAISAQRNSFEPLQIQVPDLHGVEKFGGTKTSSKTHFYKQSKNA